MTMNDYGTPAGVAALEAMLEATEESIEAAHAALRNNASRRVDIAGRDESSDPEVEALDAEERDLRARLAREEDLRAVLPEKIKAAREAAGASEAAKAIKTLRKRAGGISGQYAQDVAQFKKDAVSLKERYERIIAAPARTSEMAAGAEALAAMFGHPEPDVTTCGPADGLVRFVLGVLKEMESKAAPHLSETRGASGIAPAMAVRIAGERLRALDGSTEALDVLDLYGKENPRAIDVARARRSAKEELRHREEVDRMVEWMEPRLASGRAPANQLVADSEKASLGRLTMGRADAFELALDRIGAHMLTDDSGNLYYVLNPAAHPNLTTLPPEAQRMNAKQRKRARKLVGG